MRSRHLRIEINIDHWDTSLSLVTRRQKGSKAESSYAQWARDKEVTESFVRLSESEKNRQNNLLISQRAYYKITRSDSKTLKTTVNASSLHWACRLYNTKRSRILPRLSFTPEFLNTSSQIIFFRALIFFAKCQTNKQRNQVRTKKTNDKWACYNDITYSILSFLFLLFSRHSELQHKFYELDAWVTGVIYVR